MSQPWPRDSNETASDQPGAVQNQVDSGRSKPEPLRGRDRPKHAFAQGRRKQWRDLALNGLRPQRPTGSPVQVSLACPSTGFTVTAQRALSERRIAPEQALRSRRAASPTHPGARADRRNDEAHHAAANRVSLVGRRNQFRQQSCAGRRSGKRAFRRCPTDTPPRAEICSPRRLSASSVSMRRPLELVR